MLVIVDTDVVSKLSCRADFRDLCALFQQRGIHVTVPETVAEEVLAAANPQVRDRLVKALLDLLREYPVLASLPWQVKWGVKRFLAGERAFRPFAEDSKALLRCAGDNDSQTIRAEKEQGTHRWDEMHAGGRVCFQALLAEGEPVPDTGDWMMSTYNSEFTHEIVLRMTLDTRERESLEPRLSEYIDWNPICRCFFEQLMLAIRRHGLEHPTASSHKGPKWEDYYISAFVGIADRFVTDDSRLRCALEQHRSLRTATGWEIRSLEQFITELQDGPILSSGPGRSLETWPAIEG
ncbi:MAG: hypothetical protein AB1696_01675 [Planctomycetota bacterium]